MSIVRFAFAAAALAVLACRSAGTPAAEPASATHTYVLLLGTDTLAADQFRMSRTRVEGTTVTHEPRTLVTTYAVTLNPATGRATQIQYRTRLPDGSLVSGGRLPPVRQVSIDFIGDSAITRIERDSVTTVRVAAPNAFPYVTYSMAFFQLPVSALRQSGRDSASYGLYTGGRVVTPIAVRRNGTSGYVLSLAEYPFAVTTDQGGVVRVVDGRGTTQQFIATRLEGAPALDLTTLASAWRAGERDSRPAAALSVRDTTTATVGSAEILVDYGDPAQDLARVPAQARPLASPVEQFTIAVEPTGDAAGLIRLQWGAQELTVPFTAP